MIQVINDIKDKTLYRLIDYLYLRCDVLTFHLPNLYQLYLTEKNIEFFSEYDLKTFRNEEDNQDFIDYKKRIDFRLNYFKSHYLNEYIDVVYFGSIHGYKSEIKVIEFKEDILYVLKTIDNLYAWKYPEMPEDLCFFSKGKCWLRSIAHENICNIYTDNDLEKMILRKIGLRFIELPDEDIPILQYALKY